MAEDGEVQVRPQEQILADLAQIKEDYDDIEEKLAPIDTQIELLPGEIRQNMQSFFERFDKEAVREDEIDANFHGEERFLVHTVLKAARDVADIERRKTLLEQEYLPYKKREFEEALEKLVSRINYDAVFDYYREIDQEVRSATDNGDMLSNTAADMYVLRQYQFNQMTGVSANEDFGYFLNGISYLNHFESEWEEKGFLHKDANPNYRQSTEFGTNVAERRARASQHAQELREQLSRYGELVCIYRPAIPNARDHQDSDLKTIHRILSQGGKALYTAENFDNVDFDPNFIAAAERHLDKISVEHAAVGRVHRNEQQRQEDRDRIDRIEPNKDFATKIDGLEAPSGMKSTVDAVQLRNQMETLIPHDFLVHLQSVSHKPHPEKNPDDDPGIETIGRFKPVFGEGSKWDKLDTTVIEIYASPFVPMDAAPVSENYARQQYVDTTWHEIGHNAHYTLNYDEMISWEHTISEDKTAITWYVNHSREDDENKGKREDFSETFMMYLSDPALLEVLSPPRYVFMKDYFDNHLQTQKKDAFNSHISARHKQQREEWNNKGFDDSDVRYIYQVS